MADVHKVLGDIEAAAARLRAEAPGLTHISTIIESSLRELADHLHGVKDQAGKDVADVQAVVADAAKVEGDVKDTINTVKAAVPAVAPDKK